MSISYKVIFIDGDLGYGYEVCELLKRRAGFKTFEEASEEAQKEVDRMYDKMVDELKLR